MIQIKAIMRLAEIFGISQKSKVISWKFLTVENLPKIHQTFPV